MIEQSNCTSPMGALEPTLQWALFLDLDGTLLDIAPTPDRVVVPSNLVHDLASVYVTLGGALAIVSGRTLSDLDGLLSPLHFPGGAEHGAVLRLPDGTCDEVEAKIPPEVVDALAVWASDKSGLMIERKAHSVVAHFRRATHFEDECREFCAQLIAGQETDLEVLAAKMAFEIRHRLVTKGRAVRRLMALEPFKGRRPIFVGDDVTDEDGFRAVEALGGEAVCVDTHFAGRPSKVRSWLKSVAAL